MHTHTHTHAWTHTIILLCKINGGWREKETVDGECEAVLHTLEDKLVCGPLYLFSWITFISVIMFFFLSWLSEAACVVSVYKSESWCEKKELISACGGQWVLYWGYSITEHHILNRKCRSHIYSCFWKENLNKDGCFFFHLFHFLSPISVGIFLVLPGWAECVGFHFKQGSHVHHITRGLS